MQTISSWQDIIQLFDERGHRHYGEDVTEREHALQAAELAAMDEQSDEVILACLLHDIGHLLHDHGEDAADRGVDARHEYLGAAALQNCAGEAILDSIRLHVAAKRYLCATDPEYLPGLSEASRQSLELQGGPMTRREVAEFEMLPHFEAIISVRLYDDMAKVPDMKTRPLEAWQELAERLLFSAPSR